MVHGLFRWDNSPGLEHHCPKCHTPLHNARAKNTCYFKHVEICSRFHQHFFLIGQAHTCATCRCNTEAHNQRHRDIAFLLRDFFNLQASVNTPDTSTASSSPSTPRRRSSVLPNDAEEDQTPSPVDGLKKRERKKAKKRLKALKGGDALTTEELEFVAWALHREPIAEGGCDDLTSSPPRPFVATAASSAAVDSSPTDEQDAPANKKNDVSTPRKSRNRTTTSLTPGKSGLTDVIATHKSFHKDVDGKLNKTRMSLQKDLLDSLSASEICLDSAVDDAMVRLGVYPSSQGKRMSISGGAADKARVSAGGEKSKSNGGGNSGTKGKDLDDLKAKIKEKVIEDLECWGKDWRNERIREAGWYRFVTRSVLAKGVVAKGDEE